MKNFIKKYFLTGFLVLVPITITIAVLYWLVLWLASKLQFGIIPYESIVQNVPESLQRILTPALKFTDVGLSLIIVIAAILIAGVIARNYIGNKVISYGERIIERVPLGGMVYKAVKQLVDSIFSSRERSFSRVVMVEYPKKDSWVLAFVSREAADVFNEKTGQKMLNLFVPTTPNPTSGFLLMVPESMCIETGLDIEEAFQVIISGGVIHPGEKPKKDQQNIEASKKN